MWGTNAYEKINKPYSYLHIPICDIFPVYSALPPTTSMVFILAVYVAARLAIFVYESVAFVSRNHAV